tara:strand:- start:1386 stop:2315 length:930 start_codon:yes stop_codon:yes gene_type:complete
MKVHYGIESYKEIKNPVVTVGTFDGVHFGHQKIINRLQNIAAKCNGESVLLTFNPHPRKVLFKNRSLKLINTIDEKITILSELGLDHLVIYPFTDDFSKFSADEYISELLVKKLKTHYLVIGYDHHFGNKREGNISLLKAAEKKYPFNLEEIKAHEIDEIKVSSTKIRNAIDNGNIHLFKDYCGRNFEFSGNVVYGNGIGKTINTATANINIKDEDKIRPADGVYAVLCQLKNKIFKGIMNIGIKPSIDIDNKKTIEVHLFDFDNDIYDKLLKIEVVSKIRNEIKFPTLEKLKHQITKDIKKAKEILTN